MRIPGTNTLDRYIMRQFITTYFFAIALIITICVVFDFAEKIDDFMNEACTTREIIVDYYLNFIPYFANLFSSLFVFIAVIFFTSKMTQRSEVIAILSSGVSFRRLLVPYFFAATLLFLFSLVLSHFVIPPANRIRLGFENKYVRSVRYQTNNIHRQMRPGFFVFIQNYHAETQEIRRLALESFQGPELRSKLMSDYGRWDTAKQCWKLRDYYIRYYLDGRDSLVRGRDLDTAFFIEPQDMAQIQHNEQSLNYWELDEYIDQQILQGAPNLNTSLVERYSRTATPFATYILTVIGVCVSTKKRRGGMGLQISIGLALSFSYIVFQRFSSMFAIQGSFPPFIAAWMPNVIFAIIAYVLYRLAPK